jgi:hypothetical protein
MPYKTTECIIEFDTLCVNDNYVSVHGVWAIPDAWERKRLACSDAGAPPSQSLPLAGGGQVGALNDYTITETITETITMRKK